jgi:hypothetical protein
LPEIPPVLPFSKGGELWGIRWRIPSIFSLWKRGKKGEKGGFDGFSKGYSATHFFYHGSHSSFKKISISAGQRSKPIE